MNVHEISKTTFRSENRALLRIRIFLIVSEAELFKVRIRIFLIVSEAELFKSPDPDLFDPF